jgi:hypothetical protein
MRDGGMNFAEGLLVFNRDKNLLVHGSETITL